MLTVDDGAETGAKAETEGTGQRLPRFKVPMTSREVADALAFVVCRARFEEN